MIYLLPTNGLRSDTKQASSEAVSESSVLPWARLYATHIFPGLARNINTYTPYMTVCMVITPLETPCVHCLYVLVISV